MFLFIDNIFNICIIIGLGGWGIKRELYGYTYTVVINVVYR